MRAHGTNLTRPGRERDINAEMGGKATGGSSDRKKFNGGKASDGLERGRLEKASTASGKERLKADRRGGETSGGFHTENRPGDPRRQAGHKAEKDEDRALRGLFKRIVLESLTCRKTGGTQFGKGGRRKLLLNSAGSVAGDRVGGNALHCIAFH